MITVQTIDFITQLFPMNSVSFERLLEVEKVFYESLISYWYEHNFLTGRWWFLVFLSIFPAIFWWKIVNKQKITEITAFGLFYGVAATVLDSIGSSLMVWAYPFRLSPYVHPQFYPYDVGIVIIPFMLVYQKWSSNFKKYFFGTGVLSLFLAFVAEPFMEWLNIYKEITWKNVYSFPIYWLLGLICWGILKYFKKIEQQ